LDNVITQGLALSVVGLVVAFAFMGLFILTMVVLQKLFPVKKAEPEATPVEVEAPAIPAAVSASVEEEDDELGMVAAAVAAVASLRSLNQSKLGDALASGRGSWWSVNQIAARQRDHSRN
jgi:sodium pump decarboxylase gamma subunit